MEQSIALRCMKIESLHKLESLDRSEIIRTGYKIVDGELTAAEVQWNVPSFFKNDSGDHSVQAQIDFCRGHLERGGIMVGAFHGEVLVGVGVLTPHVRPEVAQLAYLQVSSEFRRTGVATSIVRELERKAVEFGSVSIYVSATPSDSAVNFYLSRGYEMTNQPIQELVQLEPEDIHMCKDL